MKCKLNGSGEMVGGATGAEFGVVPLRFRKSGYGDLVTWIVQHSDQTI